MPITQLEPGSSQQQQQHEDGETGASKGQQPDDLSPAGRVIDKQNGGPPVWFLSWRAYMKKKKSVFSRAGFRLFLRKKRFWAAVVAMLLVTGLIIALAVVTTRAAGNKSVTADLGYGIFSSVEDGDTGINVWKGIPYAAPPTGLRRWQAPRPPVKDRTLKVADRFPDRCPQAQAAHDGTPTFDTDRTSENCLFLNVYAPPAGKDLPVLVFIHGGGYGEGSGSMSMSEFIINNGREVVAVGIQYRLGAFGFASSAELKDRGVVNAGLLDQIFALEWVQSHITQFGGDPRRVTVSGESAGGGAVMHLAMARNGTLGNKLWKHLIASSPYVPGKQYDYDAKVPTELYYSFADRAGCGSEGDVFDCLVKADTMTLQQASTNVSQDRSLVPFANWGFLPVTDGELVTGAPSVQLAEGKVNGEALLVGNNANEGASFAPVPITSEDDVTAWLRDQYPNLSNQDVDAILDAYPSTSASTDGSALRYATDGHGDSTALQNIYAEATFDCPGYWMASSFARQGKRAYRYQYSVPLAVHAADVGAIFGAASAVLGADLLSAFPQIWGNMVKSGDPSIPNRVANGALSADPETVNSASEFPAWTEGERAMHLVLNQTGGTAVQTSFRGLEATVLQGPGLSNNFTVADAYAWEGGRGVRCKFWQQLSPSVPQ